MGVKLPEGTLGYLHAEDSSRMSMVFVVGRAKNPTARFSLFIGKFGSLSPTDSLVWEPGGSFAYIESLVKYVRSQVERLNLSVKEDTLGAITVANSQRVGDSVVPACYACVAGGVGKGMEACKVCKFSADCGFLTPTEDYAHVETDEEIMARVKAKMEKMKWA